MNEIRPIRNFIKSAIEGLSKEEFDQAVKIFQLNYLRYEEVIQVDGPNDGGCDIKIFKNKREVQKCVQITINKTIESKLFKDLEKVDKLISNFKYSNQFDFYCTVAISNEKIEEYKKFARENYGIELDIYETQRLSQLNCKELRDYVYSLHSDVVLKPEEVNINKATKTLYDLLANGRDTSDIKNCFLNSVIVSIIYEKAPIDITALKEELEKRLGKNLPDISHALNLLKTNHRIIKDPSNSKLLRLSDDEFESVKDIIASSTSLEKNFIKNLSNILEEFGIKYNRDILMNLKQLYRASYEDDIENKLNNDDIAIKQIFESFKNNLLIYIHSDVDIDSLINKIKNLCSVNNYLNRVSASEFFLNLYKSNQLEQYIDQKHKDIFLDTPTFIYYICSMSDITNNDWDNPFYQSMKSLAKLQETNSDRIKFYIINSYLGEVAGEIQKALQIAKFEDCPFFEDLGETRNTFFNYYRYLKKKELLEEGIDSFDAFLDSLGFDVFDPNNKYFYHETETCLYEIVETMDVEIVEKKQFDDFNSIRDNYEKQLYLNKKEKSKIAINNDVNLVLLLLERINNTSDCYFATWDSTLFKLRDDILYDNNSFSRHYFNIQNPAKLSNKIALENFNIDNSALTNGIFAYADKQYGISSKVKSLLELIAPILNSDGHKNSKLIRQLVRIRKEQLELRSSNTEKAIQNENLPIEEVIIKLIPNEEMRNKNENIMQKFTSFMNSDKNVNYILNIIKEMLNKRSNHAEYDLSIFYNKINDTDIS